MDVAIRGDLASCLTLRLAPSTWVFAIARGFGEVDGAPIARVALARFENECRNRTRSETRRRRLLRSHVAAGILCGALARVNSALYLRTAGNDDYVPSACSLSAALVVRNRAYVAHAGATAVYLVHHGDVLPLTGTDAFDGGMLQPILTRALGVEPALNFAVSSIALESGDALAFCPRADGPEHHALRVGYEPSDDAWSSAMQGPRPHRLREWLTALLHGRSR
jgi:serine/threonine protein phosphatase PrpC